MRRLLPTTALLALLAGCGKDDAPLRTATVPGDRTIVVKADEYRFGPGRLIVTGGASRLKLTLDNVGSLAHNIRVFDGERELGGVRSFPPGQQRSTTIGVKPGRYRYVCTVGDHAKLGMRGELVVR